MTAYDMRISDWSSDWCSSDLNRMLPREWPPFSSRKFGERHPTFHLRRNKIPPLSLKATNFCPRMNTIHATQGRHAAQSRSLKGKLRPLSPPFYSTARQEQEHDFDSWGQKFSSFAGYRERDAYFGKREIGRAHV